MITHSCFKEHFPLEHSGAPEHFWSVFHGSMSFWCPEVVVTISHKQVSLIIIKYQILPYKLHYQILQRILPVTLSPFFMG